MKHADKSKRTRNLCNAAMLCCAAAVLLTGLGRTLLRPKDVNYYENRPANTVAPLTAESWLDGSFQDAMEAAPTCSSRWKRCAYPITSPAQKRCLSARRSSFLSRWMSTALLSRRCP